MFQLFTPQKQYGSSDVYHSKCFIPFDNNLFGKGGSSIKVECIVVRDYEECKRSSYKQVTDEEGNFTYPHIPENLEKKR